MKVKRNLKRLLSVAAAVATVATGTALMGMAADGGVTEGTPATPDHPYYAWAAMTEVKGIDLLDGLELYSPNKKNEDGSVYLSVTGNPLFKFAESKSIDLNANPYLYWSVNQAASSKFSFGVTAEDNTSYSRVTGLDDQGVPLFEQLNNVPVSKRFTGSETGCINLKELVGADTLTLQGICAAGTRAKPTINYLFVGPAPGGDTTTSEETTTTTTESTTTKPAPVIDTDFMPADVSGITGDNMTAVMENGALKITASAATTVDIPVGKAFNIVDTSNVYVKMKGEEAHFGVQFFTRAYKTAGELVPLNPKLEGDWGPNFGGATEMSGIAPGLYDQTFTLIGAYKWNIWGGGSATVPEGCEIVTLDKVSVTFWDAGTFMLYDLNATEETVVPTVPTSTSETTTTTTTESTTTMTESTTTTTESTTTTTESTTKPTTPVETKTSIISFNPEDWTTEVPENMEIVKGADGSLEISNTNGAWPAAGYALPDGGITFDPAKTSLNYDFTVGPDTNIILFFNGSTPDDYQDGQHKTISHKIDGAQLNGDDIQGNGASFKGSFSLDDPDYFPAGCYNEDGTMTLTGVRIFAAGAAGSKVVVRELSIVTEGAPTEPTDTQPTETDPTETEPTDTQPTDTQPTETEPTGTDSSVNTTASSATTAATASTQKDNPKTGDDLTLICLGLALMAVSAGALFFFRRKQA